MTDLTERWKAGELEDGFYYLMVNGNFEISECINNNIITITGYDDVKVLVPVPSFKELQSFKAQLAEHKEYCCCAKNEVLVLENARLKELLKECLPIVSAEIMSWQIRGGEEARKRGKEFLTKIEEVLK